MAGMNIFELQKEAHFARQWNASRPESRLVKDIAAAQRERKEHLRTTRRQVKKSTISRRQGSDDNL